MERGDTSEVTGIVDVQPSAWFTPLVTRHGAASMRATSGNLNLTVQKGNEEFRQTRFSVRVAPSWNNLPYVGKNKPTLNLFKNAYDNLDY